MRSHAETELARAEEMKCARQNEFQMCTIIIYITRLKAMGASLTHEDARSESLQNSKISLLKAAIDLAELSRHFACVAAMIEVVVIGLCL